MSAAGQVSSRRELIAAVGRPGPATLRVEGVLDDLPTLRLAPAVSLQGGAGAQLLFAAGQDGLKLTADNAVTALLVRTEPQRRAVFNASDLDDLGHIALKGLEVTGCVRLLARGRVRSGRVTVDGLDLIAADARAFPERPSGYGVEVVPGAFTLWNLQEDAASELTAELTNISVGRSDAPVRGSGVFIGGVPSGGRVRVGRLTTGEVHSHGGIPPGTANRISGGVFVVHGARVKQVINRRAVTTYGPNDMVLDNWGSVEQWIAEDKVTSHGPSGIGFVNFGDLDVLKVEAPIETHGLGARGFNVYAGTLRDAELERVVTHADGAVGIQISRPVGRIAVKRGVETFGGIGDSLVKGVVTKLPAIAFSVKPGGAAVEVTIRGGLRTHGEKMDALELHGEVDSFSVAEGFGPQGAGFEAI